MRGRRPIRAFGLYQIQLQRPAGKTPRFELSLNNTTGHGSVEGRMTWVALTPAELARVLGEMPALTMTSDEDAIALHRVAQMLRDWQGLYRRDHVVLK